MKHIFLSLILITSTTPLVMAESLPITPASADRIQNQGAAQQTIAQTPRRSVRGYSIVLLIGDTTGSAMPSELSAPARKALSDVRDFLPFKSYRLLDTYWSAASDQESRASGQLRGPADEQLLPFTLEQVGKAHHKFALWAADRKGTLLETTFAMNVGETVVVGTSRIPGDRALIVLMTTVPDNR
jgi:hypothetical protein